MILLRCREQEHVYGKGEIVNWLNVSFLSFFKASTFNSQCSLREDSHSDTAASSNSTKDWPSGLCRAGGLGAENVRGSTVFCSHPWLSTLFRISRNARYAHVSLRGCACRFWRCVQSGKSTRPRAQSRTSQRKSLARQCSSRSVPFAFCIGG